MKNRQKEPTKIVNVRLPHSLWKAVKIIGAKQEKSINTIILERLNKFVQRHENSLDNV